jgi:hypothetical protein
MEKKKFDCVEMKREAQGKIQKQLENLNMEQQLEFWRIKHKELLKKFDIKEVVPR